MNKFIDLTKRETYGLPVEELGLLINLTQTNPYKWKWTMGKAGASAFEIHQDYAPNVIQRSFSRIFLGIYWSWNNG